ncbi:MAG TPA: M28 family peptidase, partial [Polyangiaceae bacterium]|nr:M28 family peptidase [Polyangiaceae bacterium]
GRLKRSNSLPTDPYILVGAHYDTWSVGATDNGTGVAAMLEIAETLNWANGGDDDDDAIGAAKAGKPGGTEAAPGRRYDIVFVGYDAEEVGLLGGYDYLRRHVVKGHDSIVSFVHLEMIGRAQQGVQEDALARFFVYSKGGPLERVTGEADMGSIYPNVLGLENVAPLSGGLIPTDVQGMYWSGIDGTIAFGASPFYHTSADTPSTVDLPFLATNTAALRQLVNEVDQEPAASFGSTDPNRMYPEVHVDRSNPAFARVDVTVRDFAGQPVPTPWARVQLFVDDFITPQQAGVPAQNAAVQEVVGDQNGKVTFDIASSLMKAGKASRWVHVRVGKATERFPRGEGVVEIN